MGSQTPQPHRSCDLTHVRELFESYCGEAASDAHTDAGVRRRSGRGAQKLRYCIGFVVVVLVLLVCDITTIISTIIIYVIIISSSINASIIITIVIIMMLLAPGSDARAPPGPQPDLGQGCIYIYIYVWQIPQTSFN